MQISIKNNADQPHLIYTFLAEVVAQVGELETPHTWDGEFPPVPKPGWRGMEPGQGWGRWQHLLAQWGTDGFCLAIPQGWKGKVIWRKKTALRPDSCLYALLGHGGLMKHIVFQSDASSPSCPRGLRKWYLGCALHPGAGGELHWPGTAGLTMPQTCHAALVGVRVSFPQPSRVTPLLAACGCYVPRMPWKSRYLSTLKMVLAH